MPRKLTQKQEKFVQEMLKNGGNATDAYRAAYNVSNMKPKTVEKRANELKNNGVVKGWYEKLLEPIRKKAESEAKMNAEKIIDEYSRIVNADVMDFFESTDVDEVGRPVYIYAPNDKADTKTVKSVRFNDEGALVGLELYDKQTALAKLERIFDASGAVTKDTGIKVEFDGVLGEFSE